MAWRYNTLTCQSRPASRRSAGRACGRSCLAPPPPCRPRSRPWTLKWTRESEQHCVSWAYSICMAARRVLPPCTGQGSCQSTSQPAMHVQQIKRSARRRLCVSSKSLTLRLGVLLQLAHHVGGLLLHDILLGAPHLHMPEQCFQWCGNVLLCQFS